MSDKKALDFLEGRSESPDQGAAEAFLDSKGEPESSAPVAPSPVETQPTTIENLEQGILKKPIEFATNFNSIIADTLGIPGDIASFVAKKMGSEKRFFGSDEIKDLANIPQELPDTPTGRAGKYSAIGVEFLLPLLKLGKTATQLPQAARESIAKVPVGVEAGASTSRGIAQQIAAPFKIAPKTAYATELAASSAAGVGAFYGKQEYGETGELLGGLLAPVGLTATVPVLAPRLYNWGTRTLFPYTDAGGKSKAAARLKELSETGNVIKTLEKSKTDVLPSAKIPPAKLSGDKHLIALQNRILKDDPNLYHKFELEAQAVNHLALEEMKKVGGGSIENTQAWLGYRVKRVKDLVNRRVDSAIAKAKESLVGLTPAQQRRQVNTVVNSQVKVALTEARAVEKETWEKLNLDVPAVSVNLKTAWGELTKGMNKASDPEDVPAYVWKMLGGIKDGKVSKGVIGDHERAKVLHSFRSTLGGKITSETAKLDTNWNTVRILEDLRDAALKDIEGASKEFGGAVAVSRELNQKFKGGIMNTILGHEKTGGRMAPEISLESIKGGPKSALAIKKILEASPQSFGMTEELIKLNMVQSNVISSSGRINLNAARKYLEKNEDLLELFPDTLKSLNKAMGAEERARSATEIGKGRLSGIEKSRAAKVSGSKPGRVLSDILSSQNSAGEMAKVLSQSNKAGRKGLKNDVVDYLINKSRGGAFDEHGDPTISGRKMLSIWKEEGATLKLPMSKDERSRVDRIINTFIRNSDQKPLPVVEDIVKPDNPLVSMVVTVIAARAGAKLGQGTSGASLKTASALARFANKVVNSLDTARASQLLKDAIQDPELFKALYRTTSTPKQAAFSDKILQGWMAAHAVSTMEEK